MAQKKAKKLKAVSLQPQFEGLLSEADYKAFWSGRGGGKSYAIADYLLLMGIVQPCVILCLREIQSAIKKSVYTLMAQRIEIHKGWSSHYTVAHDHIRGVNGTVIWFLGLSGKTRDNLRSIEGVTHCWVTEAHDISAKSLETLLPTIRAEEAEIIFDWNPQSPKDPVDAMFRTKEGLAAIAAAELKVELPNPKFPISWKTNRFLSKVARKRAEASYHRDKEQYEHDYGGGYQVRTDRLIFRRGRDWDTMDYVPSMRDHLPAYYGADFGFTDPTTLIEARVDSETGHIYIGRTSYKRRTPLDRIPFEWSHVLKGRTNEVIRGDSANPQILMALRKYFPNLQGAIKGPGSVGEGLYFLQQWKILVDPQCEELIEELENYGWKVNQHTDELTDTLDDDWNHCIDALRYAIEPLRYQDQDLVGTSQAG